MTASSTVRVDAGILREVLRDQVAQGGSLDRITRMVRMLAKATGLGREELYQQARQDALVVLAEAEGRGEGYGYPMLYATFTEVSR